MDGRSIQPGGREEPRLQLHELARSAAAQVLGLVQKGLVEHRRHEAADLLVVLVPPVSDHVEDDDAAALAELPDQPQQGPVGVGVVAVIEEVLDAGDLLQVEAPGVCSGDGRNDVSPWRISSTLTPWA